MQIMKYISFDDINNLNISPKNCIDWVDSALRIKDQSILPAKISLHPATDSFITTMPIIIPIIDSCGVKIVTRKPDRTPSLDSEIILYSLKNLNSLAIMDGNWITAARTGAVAVHTIQNFAVEKFETIALIGLGNTCRMTIKILLSVYEDRPLKLKLKKYKTQHDGFIEYVKKFAKNPKRITFEVFDSNEELVTDSDIVISAVSFTENDFCAPKYYKQGCLIIAIHTRGFMECDLQFDKVVFDDYDHVKHFKYADKWVCSAPVSEIIMGRAAGRVNDGERIIAYNIGLALHDIYYAKKIYDLLKDNAPSIDLKSPSEKFWV
jgi:ornithine cyclodeaminase/alanine dehydrogenase